ncbi:MAG: 3'(2'),5'-bisphosphate nucleotidase CysQ [Rubrivivax sp.]
MNGLDSCASGDSGGSVIDRDLLLAVESIARRAAEVVMAVYGSDFEVEGKADASPVTRADREAEALIVPALQALTPHWQVVAEEAVAAGDTPQVGSTFWLVDPLDGTREFVARNGEFTVNIALIRHGMPILGVVLLPVSSRLYGGWVGHGAWLDEAGLRRSIHCRAEPAEGATVACSRSHGDRGAIDGWLGGRDVAGWCSAGSSLKFGLLAEGRADLYPRFGRTMEWDTAAGHAVLLAAGGSVCTVGGAPLRYGKPGFENPHFIAAGLPSGSGPPRGVRG